MHLPRVIGMHEAVTTHSSVLQQLCTAFSHNWVAQRVTGKYTGINPASMSSTAEVGFAAKAESLLTSCVCV